MGWHQREKAGVQQELLPEAVGGKTEDVRLPEMLEQPQLSPLKYAQDRGIHGSCPDCSSQLKFAEGDKQPVASTSLKGERLCDVRRGPSISELQFFAMGSVIMAREQRVQSILAGAPIEAP
jgi:hypothetical protein